MAGKWILEVEPHSSAPSGYVLRLYLRNPQTGSNAEVLSCHSVAELEKELASLKSELDRLLQGAHEKVKDLEGASPRDLQPERVWQEMERCPSEKEMFAYFNSLDGQTRERVAEYVFTSVGMFRGRGPVFAEHYDSTSHTLD